MTDYIVTWLEGTKVELVFTEQEDHHHDSLNSKTSQSINFNVTSDWNLAWDGKVIKI